MIYKSLGRLQRFGPFLSIACLQLSESFFFLYQQMITINRTRCLYSFLDDHVPPLLVLVGAH